MKARRSNTASDGPGRVLALMVAANGHLDPCELQALEERHGFERLGVSRARFLGFVRECVKRIDGGLEECSWLRTDELAYIDPLLDAVPGAQERLLICRLAAAAMAADGCVSDGERLVYDYVLGRWHIDRDSLSDADHAPAEAPPRSDH